MAETYDRNRVRYLKKNRKYKDLFLYVQKYAQLHVEDAVFELAECYMKGLGTDKSEFQGMLLHRELASRDNLKAIYALAWDYYEGKGVRKNDRQALKYFQYAARRGHVDAKFNTGILYFNGSGTKKDEKRAFLWFEQAAVLGSAKAQFNVGISYLKGWGVNPDPVKAHYWLEQAARQGHLAAQKYIDEDTSYIALEHLSDVYELLKKVDQEIQTDTDVSKYMDRIRHLLDEIEKKSTKEEHHE